MKKIILKSLNIYTIKSNKTQVENQDFHIGNFLHFPVLTNNDGSLWKHGNLYLLSKLKIYSLPSSKTLDSIAIDLRDFKRWCNDEEIDYLLAPRKILRPTYRYRSYLQDLLYSGKISANTLKRKIGAVVGFYKYLIEVENIKFKYPLWEDGISSISYNDKYGFKQYKQVKTTDLNKVPYSKNLSNYDEVIADGGNLKPLTKEQQILLIKTLKVLDNIEMTFGFLISLLTGARMQTVFTLRLKHFERTPSHNESEIKIKVGYGTDCDTKYSKQQILFIPTWLYNKIRVYIASLRAVKRREKSKHIFNEANLQYVFLSNRGTPIYVAENDKYRVLYREAPNGALVRQFISKSVKKHLSQNGNYFDFSFHDLRATFGMNELNKGMPLVKKGEIELTALLFHIKERMAHSSLETTSRYLNYKNLHKLKIQSQDDFEEMMYGLLDE